MYNLQKEIEIARKEDIEEPEEILEEDLIAGLIMREIVIFETIEIVIEILVIGIEIEDEIRKRKEKGERTVKEEKEAKVQANIETLLPRRRVRMVWKIKMEKRRRLRIRKHNRTLTTK